MWRTRADATVGPPGEEAGKLSRFRVAYFARQDILIFAAELPVCAIRRAPFGMRVRRYLFGFLLICAWAGAGIGSDRAWGDGAAPAPFPRLMGMNIGAKNYQDSGYQKDLARLDVVILLLQREPYGRASTRIGYTKGLSPGQSGAKPE